MTKEKFYKEATRRFGTDVMNWKFVCPVCNTIISVADYKKAGASEGAIGFSCIGRYLSECQKAFGNKPVIKGQPCDYTGGGLFGLNPMEVDGHHYFNFADSENPELVSQ
jgi:hypothetical protein